MNLSLRNKNLLGINGLGRIGKLVLWNQIHLKQFEGIVVNCGRDVGKELDDLLQVSKQIALMAPSTNSCVV
jgi:glyceraldehyde 3-phosphate dehydrogenase